MKVIANMLIRDEEKYVGKTIESVIDYVDRILIVDNGSTDDTLNIVKSYSKYFADGKIWLWEAKNSAEDEHSLLLYRNAMLFYSICEKADWMMILDGHEVWKKSELDIIVNKIMPENKEKNMLSFPYYQIIGPRMLCVVNTYRVGQPHSPNSGGMRIGRFINLNVTKGLHWRLYQGWPRETLVDENDQEIGPMKNMYIDDNIRFFHFNFNRSRNDSLYAHRQQGPVEGGSMKDIVFPEVFAEGEI